MSVGALRVRSVLSFVRSEAAQLRLSTCFEAYNASPSLKQDWFQFGELAYEWLLLECQKGAFKDISPVRPQCAPSAPHGGAMGAPPVRPLLLNCR